jgi:lipoprotein NlpI
MRWFRSKGTAGGGGCGRTATALRLLALLSPALVSCAGPLAQSPEAVFERATSAFLAGRISESAAAFDDLAKLVPGKVPQLWQRGITLYYAGRYKDCRTQFEAHRTVNPNDVENAAWHFLCVARDESADKAKLAILPVGPDTRVPMREVYQMFQGALPPERVMAAAGTLAESQFYAHLYLGLYFEALGMKARALEHIAAAAADRFQPLGGYMHDVARVHLGLLRGGK